jgi:hypothetical protein
MLDCTTLKVGDIVQFTRSSLEGFVQSSQIDEWRQPLIVQQHFGNYVGLRWLTGVLSGLNYQHAHNCPYLALEYHVPRPRKPFAKRPQH